MTLLLLIPVWGNAEDSVSPEMEQWILKMGGLWRGYTEEQMQPVSLKWSEDRQICSFVIPSMRDHPRDFSYFSLYSTSIFVKTGNRMDFWLGFQEDEAKTAERTRKIEQKELTLKDLQQDMQACLERNFPFLEATEEDAYLYKCYHELSENSNTQLTGWSLDHVYVFKAGTDHPLSGWLAEVCYFPVYDEVIYVTLMPLS